MIKTITIAHKNYSRNENFISEEKQAESNFEIKV